MFCTLNFSSKPNSWLSNIQCMYIDATDKKVAPDHDKA